jgi:hypothetical protein
VAANKFCMLVPVSTYSSVLEPLRTSWKVPINILDARGSKTGLTLFKTSMGAPLSGIVPL